MRKACGNWLEVRATVASRPGTIACMRTLEAVDMSSTRANVLHMSKMIQIRNVPDDLHRELKMRAEAGARSAEPQIDDQGGRGEEPGAEYRVESDHAGDRGHHP
jgi:hypothetical protein